MSACSGCGGVVGIDCFRPSECEEASEDMERRQLAYQVETLRAQLEAAEAEVANLRTANIAYSQQVNELIGRAGNAESRAEAAEANAARYEWLRGAEGLNLGLLDLVDEELDAAIDAAMSRTKEETNHE